MAEEKLKTYSYGNVRISLENCILPHEKVETPPSIHDGLDPETEMDLRILGCELIQSGGILLKLPQVAMATGQVLFQRFYYSKSFVKHDFEVVAMACIFLAAKVEESPRRIRDVVNVFHHIKQKLNNKTPVPMEYMGNSYFNLKNAVIKAERRVLKELGFCVHVKHPHKIIITYLQILECNNNQSLAQRAWNFMNDSLRTNVFVRYKPETIACACIFLAARQLKIILPTKPPWWDLFEAEYKEIEDISLTILKLYERTKPNLHKLETKVNSIRKIPQDKKGKEKDGNSSPSQSPANQSNPASRTGSPSKVSPLVSADGTTTTNKKTTSKNDENREKKNSSVGHEGRRPGHKHSRPRGYSRSRSRSPSGSRSRSHSRSQSRSPLSPKRAHTSPNPKRRSPHSPRRVQSHSDSESDSDISDHSDHEKIKNLSPAHDRIIDKLKQSEKSKDLRSKIDIDRKYKSSKEDFNSYNRIRDRSRSPLIRSHERLKEKHRGKYDIDRDYDYHREKRREEKRRKGDRNGEDYRIKTKSRDNDKYKR